MTWTLLLILNVSVGGFLEIRADTPQTFETREVCLAAARFYTRHGLTAACVGGDGILLEGSDGADTLEDGPGTDTVE